jgi:hypothetical protein
MRLLIRTVLALAICGSGLPALAQSPNTGSIVIVVVDETGGVITAGRHAMRIEPARRFGNNDRDDDGGKRGGDTKLTKEGTIAT